MARGGGVLVSYVRDLIQRATAWQQGDIAHASSTRTLYARTPRGTTAFKHLLTSLNYAYTLWMGFGPPTCHSFNAAYAPDVSYCRSSTHLPSLSGGVV